MREMSPRVITDSLGQPTDEPAGTSSCVSCTALLFTSSRIPTRCRRKGSHCASWGAGPNAFYGYVVCVRAPNPPAHRSVQAASPSAEARARAKGRTKRKSTYRCFFCAKSIRVDAHRVFTAHGLPNEVFFALRDLGGAPMVISASLRAGSAAARPVPTVV
jgi:hypothetical protein